MIPDWRIPMCGIVGYTGHQQAIPFLLHGLEKLEYRGYDSAGVAVMSENRIVVKKTKGRLSALKEKIENEKNIITRTGIGHTRWATHGEPTDLNAHPHRSNDGRFAVVHNGIIENYLFLRSFLTEKGFSFLSDTDTEVIAHLIQYYYQGDMLKAIAKVSAKIEGSYALGILCIDHPDTLFAIKKEAPLVIGLGQGENFIASDIPALLRHTRDVYFLENHEIAVLEKNSVHIYNQDFEEIKKKPSHIDWNLDDAEKGGYEHFMLKEIMEQPSVIWNTLSPHIKDNHIDLSISKEHLSNITKTYMIGCGSAYHVCLVGKQLFESILQIPTEPAVASEFRYMSPIIDENTLVIAISQSGETADTVAAIREAKKKGGKILSIVNMVGSTIARESDFVLYTMAGPEISVATTKAYSTQLAILYLLTLYLAQEKDVFSKGKISDCLKELELLPKNIEKLLQNKEEIQHTAALHYNSKNVFFLGRNFDYAVAQEGALKLKEISYIHSEAYPAGELKHGPIALIEKGSLVIALCGIEALYDKMLSNIREAKARGAVVIVLVKEGHHPFDEVADHIFTLPCGGTMTVPSQMIVPLQLFAYYVASLKSLDIDKPRNLAKSVTVE